MTTLQETPTIDYLLRKARGNTHQTEVAAKFDVSRNGYKAWETGHAIPEAAKWAEALADHLDITVQEIVWILYVSAVAKLERENVSLRVLGLSTHRPLLQAA